MERLFIVLTLLVIAAFSSQANAASLSWMSKSGIGNTNESTFQPLFLVHENSMTKGQILDSRAPYIGAADDVMIDIKDITNDFFNSRMTLGDILNQVNKVKDETVIRAGVLDTPIPAAVWLFGSALLGLAGLTFRRKITVSGQVVPGRVN